MPAWIKKTTQEHADDNADLYAGSAAVIATIAAFSALWAIGM